MKPVLPIRVAVGAHGREEALDQVIETERDPHQHIEEVHRNLLSGLGVEASMTPALPGRDDIDGCRSGAVFRVVFVVAVNEMDGRVFDFSEERSKKENCLNLIDCGSCETLYFRRGG